MPRLSVGVYATSASTPLYFAQAIGRFVRARRRGELASVFLPSVPVLLALAAELERERDHALDREVADGELDDGLLEQANREDAASDALLEEGEWTALGSIANFEKVLFDGDEYGVAGRARQRRGVGLHRASRHPRAGAGERAAQASPAASGPPLRGTAPGRTRMRRRAPRRCTALSPSSGSCSTASSRSAPARPARRTARFTPRRVGSAVDPEVSRATVAQLQARIDLPAQAELSE